ncbi:hypothetical protein OG500_35920 [Kitasatospora sp. NBC_01250]|uniref:acyl-CoA dehydrogenase family protein n=1 Tax=Kitasatospora sp. NBC_01250 TaxID=2903571 RepID=UPI002E2EDFE2|nr:hypothetical protein [Kitasatospora sp. NBC_01250]
MIQPPTPAHTRRRSVTAVRLPAERWESLLAAAVRPAGPGTGTGADPLALDTSAHLGLRRLAAVLPPALEAARDPELLATVSAVTALADPPLYQTFLSHYILCAGSVARLGTPDADPAGELAHAWAKGSFMVTELGDAGSHLNIRTTAVHDPATGTFRLETPDERAAKFSSVAAGGLPQKAVVCARLMAGGRDCGVFSFLVDITDAQGRPAPGVLVSSPLAVGALPLPYAAVRFTGPRLDAARWLADGAVIGPDGVLRDPLGSPGARLRRTLEVGRLLWATLPAAMAAVATRSAALTWQFSAHRRSHGAFAGGQPVLGHRPQLRAVAGALAEAFALRCAVAPALGHATAAATATATAATAAADGAGPAFAPWAAVDQTLALHKVLATRGAADILMNCQHRCGLAGFMDRNLLAGYLGLARSFEHAGGDNTLILLDTGRALAEGPPQAPPPAVPADPLDPAWWPGTVAALRYRLAEHLQRDLAAGREAGRRDLALWNPLLDRAQALGWAAALQLAARSVAGSTGPVGQVGPTSAPALDPALHATVAALYGVRLARRSAEALLAVGLLDPGRARALAAAEDHLVEVLAPQLPLLVEQLDPELANSASPLADPDYAAGLAAALTWPVTGERR